MSDQDRQDRLLGAILGDNLMVATLRLLILFGLVCAAGAVLIWYVARP